MFAQTAGDFPAAFPATWSVAVESPSFNSQTHAARGAASAGSAPPSEISRLSVALRNEE
jgi:hypothetical protein